MSRVPSNLPWVYSNLRSTSGLRRAFVESTFGLRSAYVRFALDEPRQTFEAALGVGAEDKKKESMDYL